VPRVACLHVPLFALAARLRSEPELGQEALAVFDGVRSGARGGAGQAARIVAANRVARRAGLRPGMTLTQARARVARLVARGRDPECERAAQQALLEVAMSFSPRVEDGEEGIVYLEVDGLERHFRGPEPELQMARALATSAARAGLPAGVGLAASKLAAKVAAGLPSSPTLVPAGEEARFLAHLPLARLAPELELGETLRRWGVRTVGDLARLPADDVVSRLGPAGQELHATARGLDPRPLSPRQPPPVFAEGLELEWPLVALEPFLFAARSALERLTRRLETCGLACARLELSLRLEPDGYAERALDLPAPTRDAKTLLTLVRLDLEGRPPGAPVVGFSFIAHPDRPRQAQLSLFGPPELSPDRLATTLARLFALLGPGRVGSPRPEDGHRPERFALVEYQPPPPPRVRPASAAGPVRGLLTARVLRPPIGLEVLTAARPDAAAPPCPTSVRSPRSAGIGGAVRVASGPWTMEEGWWTESPAAREYWDVELADGGLYRIFRDRTSGEWFADGIYD